MTTKKPKARTPCPPSWTSKPPSDDEMHNARAMSNGALGVTVTAAYSPMVNGGSSVQALANVLADRARAVSAGDLSDLDLMLLSQAQAMNAMFVHLATLAHRQEGRESLQTVTTLALRAAAGSRQAIEAIGELRQPRQVTFAKQANIAHGPQQVNNGMARAAEVTPAPTELLEQHEQRMVPAAPGANVGADPHLAPVGAVNRPANG